MNIKYYLGIITLNIANFLSYITTLFWKIKSNKMDGISICVKINQDKYIDILFEQMNNIYLYVGEILIHYNGIIDEEKLILKSKMIPNCILKKYESKNLDIKKYTNDFIDEMKYKWFFSFDSDIIFAKDDLINFIKKIQSSKNSFMYYFSGVNLFKDKNAKIGFSNSANDQVISAFVGCGDFICYVPHYTNEKKCYLWKDEINMVSFKSYKIKFTGLIFLHLSLLKYVGDYVDESINFKKIIENVKRWKNYRDTYFYKKIIKHTNQQVFANIMNSIKENVDLIKSI